MFLVEYLAVVVNNSGTPGIFHAELFEMLKIFSNDKNSPHSFPSKHCRFIAILKRKYYANV